MCNNRFALMNVILSMSLALLFGAPALAQFAFAPTLDVAAGPQPGGMAIGDLDGDGDLDLATGLQFPDRVLILLNNGSGGFSVGPVISFPNGSQPEEVLAGDLDGDGDNDLAVILRGLLQLRAVINNGGLVFVQGASTPTGANARGMDMKDMDNDGDLDIALANRDSNTATVIRNNGDATFVSLTLASLGEPRAAAFGDLDGDCDLDLAVTNNEGFNIRLFRNDAGTFNVWQTLSLGPDQPEGVAIADLDNDGDQDIASGTEDDNTGANNASVFLNNGNNGSFAGPFKFPTSGLGTSGVVARDLDCDGLLDLALANQDTSNVSLLRNLGGGSFGAAMLRPVGVNPETINAGDLDGDGLSDLATANRDSGNLSILINQTCELDIPGDITGDGVVNVNDLLAVINQWGPCPPKGNCPADIAPPPNGNGVVNVNDLLMVINNWS